MSSNARPDLTIRRAPPLAVQVTERLRAMLAEPVFDPGTRLVEEDLAQRLSVSRTPVREALFRLSQMGLVEQRDGGFHVPHLTLRDIEEIFEIRRLLEPQAVAGIARHTQDADMPAYIAARDRVLAATTEEDATIANVAFRALWMAHIPNQRMHEVLVRFDDQVGMVRRATLRTAEARKAALEGVCALVEAFQDRDPDRAHRIMEDFIDAAFHWFEIAVTPAEDPVR